MQLGTEVREVTVLGSENGERSSSKVKVQESRTYWTVCEETCMVCNEGGFAKSTTSPALATLALEIRAILYEAFGIQVDPSFFLEFHGELPLCKRCSFNVGTLKSIQQQINDLQTSYDQIRNDMANSILDIVSAARRSRPKTELPLSIKNKSPSELLNAFRLSEVDTLQQLIYESWQDRYTGESEDVHSSESTTWAPPSATPRPPPSSTAHKEGTSQNNKLNFQMPPRNQAPKQYRNKKLDESEPQKKVLAANNVAFMENSKIPGNWSSRPATRATTQLKNSIATTFIIPPTPLHPKPSEHGPLHSDDDEEETDRLNLDEPPTLTPQILTPLNGHHLPTLSLPMSPQLFRQDAPHPHRQHQQQLLEEESERENELSLSPFLEITETEENLCSDYELKEEDEPGEEDHHIESEEEEEEVGELEEEEDEAEEDEEEEEEEEFKVKPKRKPKKSGKRTTSTDSEFSDLQPNHEGLFVCKFCSKTFIHKYPFRDHLKTHTGEGPKCKLCAKIFPKKHNLMLHMRTHTGEKPYKCEVCRKSFADKSNLKVHLRVHTGARPYQCEYCHLTFVNSSRLVVHRRLHTGEKPFPCEICHRTFITSNQLASHTKNHFNGKPYKCDDCGKGYASSIGLQSHVNTFHGVD